MLIECWEYFSWNSLKDVNWTKYKEGAEHLMTYKNDFVKVH